MAKDKLLEESVRALKFLLPKGWEEEGRKTKGSNRLRGFKSGLQILQVLLLHVGQGYSLRETAAVSQAGGLAEISDVGILKRLRKSEEWLRRLCELLTEGASNNKGIVMPGRQLRIVDGTSVKEPGKTGSEWLVHFSMRLPILHCDDLKITPKRGAGNGEYLSHYSVEKGDTFLADAGYFHPRGIRHVTSQGGDVLIRASISGWKIRDSMSQTLNIPKTLSSTLRKGGETGEWDVEFGKEGTLVKGRLCVMRKSSHAITQMNSRLKRKGKKNNFRDSLRIKQIRTPIHNASEI